MNHRTTATTLASIALVAAGGASARADTRDAGIDQYGSAPALAAPTELPTVATPLLPTGQPQGVPADTRPGVPSTKPTSPSGGKVKPAATDQRPAGGSAQPGTDAPESDATPQLNRPVNATTKALTVPANCAPRLSYVEFGPAPASLRRAISRAAALDGFKVDFQLRQTDTTLSKALDASKLLRGDTRAAGRAFGSQLVTPAASTGGVYSTLNTPRGTAFLPAGRVIITRRRGLKPKQVAFLEGVASGLKATGIPVVYIERSTDKPSYVGEFKRLGVPAIRGTNPNSVRKLAALIAGTCTEKGIQAVPTSKIQLSRASATTGTGHDSPGGILALLAGGTGLLGFGAVRRRARRGV